MKKPLLWLGTAICVLVIYQNVSPYLDIHYLEEGEMIVNDYPEIYQNGDVFDGYVPTENGLRREMWEERIRENLISEFGMDKAGAQSVIDEMKAMDIKTACAHLEGRGFYNAYYEYVNTAYHKGTREEINSYMAEKLGKQCIFILFFQKICRFCRTIYGIFRNCFIIGFIYAGYEEEYL